MPERTIGPAGPVPDALNLKRRMRRLRGRPALRALVRETHLAPDDFVYPIFVAEDAEAAASRG